MEIATAVESTSIDRSCGNDSYDATHAVPTAGGCKSNSDDDGETERHASTRMRGAFLVWEDLTVLVAQNSIGLQVPQKRILQRINGFAQPGRIMAVMGPSGSGKSTLLDSLAGRLSNNIVMDGNILLNGKRINLDYGGVAYVTQEDVLLSTLTIRETLMYSAHLRLSPSLTNQDIEGIVEGTILDLGLQDCADRVIGNWHLRGVSGGEKKRLSIALEILTRPQLLFLDEPTTGLDSAASFFVVQILRNLSAESRTIIFSIHQPSSELFSLFDDLYLLSGGETVYFGEAKEATKFFAEAGFPCPSRRNPSDHFLRCINSDFDKVEAALNGSFAKHKVHRDLDALMYTDTSTVRATLVEKFRWSDYAMRNRQRMQDILSTSGLEVPKKQSSQASYLKQLSTLTRRSFKNMSRDIGYYWVRIGTYIILALAVGTIYYDVGTSYSSIMARAGCGGFVAGFMTFMSVGGFPSFLEELKVFKRENHNGYYGVTVYILSNFISSFPYLGAISLGAGSITYYMVRSRKEFPHFVFDILNLFGCISAVESCMMVVASLVPNYMMGLLTGAGVIGITLMVSGFFRLLPDLPKVFWRYPISYMSFASWAVQGSFKNNLIGLEFDSLSPGGQKLKGEEILHTMFGISLDHSKWCDLGAIFIIILCFRILFFLVLKVRERVSPFFKLSCAKKTFDQLKNRASFRKLAFPSKRDYYYNHQSSHSLSAQEGLSSPMA